MGMFYFRMHPIVFQHIVRARLSFLAEAVNTIVVVVPVQLYVSCAHGPLVGDPFLSCVAICVPREISKL